MKKLFQALALLWTFFYAQQALAGLDSLQMAKVRKEIESLMDKQMAQNLENDRLGKSHLNNYIIDYQKVLDDDESDYFKIKEANNGKTLWNLKGDAFTKENTGIRALLSNLNSGRTQKDRVYLVLISIYDYKRDVIKWHKAKEKNIQQYDPVDKLAERHWQMEGNLKKSDVRLADSIKQEYAKMNEEEFNKNNLSGEFVGAIMKQKIGTGDFSNRSIACFSNYTITFDSQDLPKYKVHNSIYRFTSIPKELLNLIDEATVKFDLQGDGRNEALRAIVDILAQYSTCVSDPTTFQAEVNRVSAFLDTKLSTSLQSNIYVAETATSSMPWNYSVTNSAFEETRWKIRTLEEKTGYKFFVVVDNSDKNVCLGNNLMAEAVRLKSQKLPKDGKTIFLYARLQKRQIINVGVLSSFYAVDVSNHIGEEAKFYIDKLALENAYNNELYKETNVGGFTELIVRYVHTIYRQLPKPAVVYAYQMNFKGEIVELPIQKSQHITGLDMYNLVIVQDRRVKTAINAYKSIKASQDYINSTFKEKPPQILEQNINNITAKKSLLEQLEETPSSDEDLEIIDHQIKESYLQNISTESFQTGDVKYNPTARQYTRWLLGTYVEDGLPNVFFENFLPSSPPNDAFITGNNAVKIARVKEKIDEASLALSPFGVDFIADGLGAVYCFVNNDTQGTLLYAGFALVGSADKIVKLADKTYDIVRRTASSYQISFAKPNGRMYSTFFPLVELTQVTPLFKNSTQVLLSERFLEKVRSLGLSKAEIKALDKDLFNNRSLIDAMNADVDLLDIWKEISYLKQHRKEIDFLQALKKVKNDDVWKHIEGEVYSVSSAAGGHILTNINKVNIGGEYWIYSDKIRFKVSDIQLPSPWSDGMEIMKAKKIKIFDGTQWVNKNGAGISSFFPSNWSKQKILEETALAFKKAKANPNTYWDATTNGNTYCILSSDGQIKITLFCGANGSINPLLNPANNPIIKSSFPKF